MKLSKEEVAEELQHQNRVLRELNKRRRMLELQAVQQGINTPPQITNELETLLEQLRYREAEITRLEAIAVEDQLSLVEAEYRVLLAETWNTQSGRANISKVAHLELKRLQTGLSLERSSELEHDIRSKFAIEKFYEIRPDFFLNISRVAGTPSYYAPKYDLELLASSIRFDLETSSRLFIASLPLNYSIDISDFRSKLIRSGRAYLDQEEMSKFEKFISNLNDVLSSSVLDENDRSTQLSDQDYEYYGLFISKMQFSNGILRDSTRYFLERERFRLGIDLDKAKEIERAASTELAMQAFYDIPSDYIDDIVSLMKSEEKHVLRNWKQTLEKIGYAIRLDSATTLNLITLKFPDDNSLDIDNFGAKLMHANRCLIDPEDRTVFENFISDLKKYIKTNNFT